MVTYEFRIASKGAGVTSSLQVSMNIRREAFHVDTTANDCLAR